MCVTGSEFAGGYADALSSHSVSRWREAFRSPALAVIDDVGDLVEKQPAQIELLHTIDAVVETGNQVLVTAHTVPSRIPRLLSALASRLTAGLVVAVPLPGPRGRLAMLLRMAADRDISMDDAALHLLARALPVTIPELSGALHEITAGCVGRQTVTQAMVAAYLRSRPTTGQTTLRAIAARTARQFALAVADLRGPSRRQNVVTARAVAVYLARQLTSQSLAAVGRYFGGRDHTTVLHGCRRAEELMAEETGVRQTVLDLRRAEQWLNQPEKTPRIPIREVKGLSSSVSKNA